MACVELWHAPVAQLATGDASPGRAPQLGARQAAAEDRILAAERARDFALAALWRSESEMQALRARPPPPAVQHLRVMLSLLARRCRLLEDRIEEQAELAARRAAASECETSRLTAAIVEQQRKHRAQVQALVRDRDYAYGEISRNANARAEAEVKARKMQQLWLRLSSEMRVEVSSPPSYDWCTGLPAISETSEYTASRRPSSEDRRSLRDTGGQAEVSEVAWSTAAEAWYIGEDETQLAPSPRQSPLQTLSPRTASPAEVLHLPGCAEFGDLEGDALEATVEVPQSAAPPQAGTAATEAPEAVGGAVWWERKGQFDQRRRRFAEARAAYETATNLDPTLHGCLANLAQLEVHEGRVAEAQRLLARALELDPSNVSYASFLRWLRTMHNGDAGADPA